MNHGQTRTHKTHHGLDLGEATTFPLMVFSMLGHGACIQMSFCLGIRKLRVLKFLKLGLLWFWRPTTSFEDFRLRWSLKQSCSPHRKLFNSMSHTTCTQVNQGDFWLLVIGSQIGTLTPDPSFGHNLCLKYPNGSCKLFEIYKFQELSNGIRNFSIQWVLTHGISIWKFGKIHRIPKMGVHLGVGGFIPSHSPTFLGTWNVIPRLHFWLTPLQTLALVMSPRLRLQHWSYHSNLKGSKE